MQSGKESETTPKMTSAFRERSPQTSTGNGDAAGAGIGTGMTAHADEESEVVVETEMKNARIKSVYRSSIHVDVH